MASKKDKKEKENPKKGKAFLDTTDSKVVKGKGKIEKAVVESAHMASSKEEFLSQLSQLRDNLHDFAVNADERNYATKELYQDITGKQLPTEWNAENIDWDSKSETTKDNIFRRIYSFKEGNQYLQTPWNELPEEVKNNIIELFNDDEFDTYGWDEFVKYWNEIEEAAKNLSDEQVMDIIQKHKYDLDPNYHGESLETDLMNALNEAITNESMRVSDVNKWLSENNLEDILSKLETEDGKYNAEDIVKFISDEKGINEDSDNEEEISLEEANERNEETVNQFFQSNDYPSDETLFNGNVWVDVIPKLGIPRDNPEYYQYQSLINNAVDNFRYLDYNTDDSPSISFREGSWFSHYIEIENLPFKNLIDLSKNINDVIENTINYYNEGSGERINKTIYDNKYLVITQLDLERAEMEVEEDEDMLEENNNIEFPELQQDTSFRDESMDIDHETEKKAINQEKNENKEQESNSESEEETNENIEVHAVADELTPEMKERIMSAIADIEKWSGEAYQDGDDVHIALEDIKNASTTDQIKSAIDTIESWKWNAYTDGDEVDNAVEKIKEVISSPTSHMISNLEEGKLSSDDDTYGDDDSINDVREKIDKFIEDGKVLTRAELKEWSKNDEEYNQLLKDYKDEWEKHTLDIKDLKEQKSHSEMKRLIHLMALKESANELVSKFGLTDVEKIKESLVEELTDEEYEIVLEDVYTTLNIEVDNDFEDNTESLNESLRSDLHDKLL
jgi:hypothetical protein